MVARVPGHDIAPLAYAPEASNTLPETAQIVMDRDGSSSTSTRSPRPTSANAAPTSFFCRPMSEVVVPARLRASHEAGLRRCRDTGEGPLLDRRFELPALRGDGTEITIELVVSRTAHQGREAFAGRFRPVVEPHPVPAELLLQADFYRALLQQSPIIVTVLDPTGVPTWRSVETGGLFTSTAGRSVADQLADLVHPADVDRARGVIAKAMENGLDEPLEVRVKVTDGSWRAVSITTRSLLDEPAVHGVAVYATDVTRAREAERQTRVEAARLMTLLESLNVAVLLQDEERRVVLANAAFVEMFALGVAPDRLRGLGNESATSPLAALFADRGDVEARTEEAVRRGRPLRGEEIALVDGRTVERDYVPITLDGSTLGHLWVFRDVTAQAELRRGLEERARMLSELSTLKTEFVAVVSHELRTPLTSINTFANMLEEDESALDPHERAAAMTAIRRNADRMLSLVSDLILLAKLESGEMALEIVAADVPTLVRRAAAASDTEQLDVEVDLADGPPLNGDAKLLAQLFDTAIGVIVAGSSARAEVVITTEVVPGTDGGADLWRVTVTTSAADVATAERLLSTHLPHPDAANERRTGALAVMLARAIATRHSGELTLLMRNPGAILTVDLPIQR